MFPSFRIISDGPLTAPSAFISNESLYDFRGLGDQPSTMPPLVPAPHVPVLLPDFEFSETPASDDSTDEVG